MTYNPTNLTERELLPEVDPDLVQRVAWGLVGGRTKAEIARAEGITLEECQAIVIRPGMWALVSIWTTVLGHLERGGPSYFAGLAKWALYYFVRGAQRQNHPALWEWVDLCKRIRWLFGIPRVSRWLAAYFEEIVAGGPRKKLPKWKLRLIQALSDAVEIASMDQLRSQYPNEALEVMVWKFRDHMMVAEVTDIAGRERPLERAEVLAKIGCEPLPVPVQRFEERGDARDWTIVDATAHSVPTAEDAAATELAPREERESGEGTDAASHDEAVATGQADKRDEDHPRSVKVGTGRPRVMAGMVSRSELPMPHETTDQTFQRHAGPAPIIRGQPPWLRLVHAVERPLAHGSPPMGRPLDPSTLHERRRRRSPPLVRHGPIGRAA